MPNVSFIIKCTRSCNFACDYCNNRRKKSSTLNFEKLVALVENAISTDKFDQFSFIFHGGEPLLLGINYYQRILLLQNLCRTEKQKIKNIIQTNGTLIDNDWISFFKANDISIGISMDGPIEIQNKHRKYKDGKETFHDVNRSLQKLKNREMSFGVLSVVTNEVLNSNSHDFIAFFMDRGVSNLGLLPLRPAKKRFTNSNSVNEYIETRNKYSSFMIDVYNHWRILDNSKFKVRELSNIFDSIVGGKSSVCIFSGACVGHYFGVNVSGEVAHCDKFFDDMRFCFGDIEENNIASIMKSDKFLRAQEIEFKIRSKCKPCDWFKICNGGCLYDAMILENNGVKDRIACCHLKKIYDHIYNFVDSELLSLDFSK